MRNSIYVLPLLTLAACTQLADESAAPQPSFSATVETIEKGRFPFASPPGGVYNDCTGEYVVFSGYFNLVVRRVVSDADQVMWLIHQGINAKGIGQTTGTEYISNEEFTYKTHDGPNSANTFQIAYPILVHSKGGDFGSVGMILIHATLDANGDLTASKVVFSFDSDCRS
jgi:hypothetical protein